MQHEVCWLSEVLAGADSKGQDRIAHSAGYAWVIRPNPGLGSGRYTPSPAQMRDGYSRRMSNVSAILKTTDMARTIEWYRQVGFEVQGVFPDSDDPSWCEVSRDGVVLQFLGGDTPWSEPPCFTGTLYFYPESVEALYEQIKEHTSPAWGPELRDWGSRELGLLDPNGYYLTFTEPA